MERAPDRLAAPRAGTNTDTRDGQEKNLTTSGMAQNKSPLNQLETIMQPLIDISPVLVQARRMDRHVVDFVTQTIPDTGTKYK